MQGFEIVKLSTVIIIYKKKNLFYELTHSNNYAFFILLLQLKSI